MKIVEYTLQHYLPRYKVWISTNEDYYSSLQNARTARANALADDKSTKQTYRYRIVRHETHTRVVEEMKRGIRR